MAHAKLQLTPEQEAECWDWLFGSTPPPEGDVYASQYGQDGWLIRHLLNFTHGTYVDLAAFHPRNISNTYALDVCLGWRGVCIEGDPAKQPAFATDPTPRGCSLAPTCVSDQPGKTVTMSSNPRMGETGVTENFDPGHASMHHWAAHRRKENVTLVTQQCQTLTQILDVRQVKHVDLLSLDIEGYEEFALMGLDFTRLTVDLILIEGDMFNYQMGIGIDNTMDAFNFLRDNDYVLASPVGDYVGNGGFRGTHIDSLWVRRESPYWQHCSWVERAPESGYVLGVEPEDCRAQLLQHHRIEGEKGR